MSNSNFESDVRIKGTLTVDGAITGDVGGGAVVSTSPLTIGGITLTDDTTVLTCSVGLQATGPIFATSSASVTYLVETVAVVAVSQAAYEVAAGVRTVTLASTGAGGPFAVTLGSNNGVNHMVTIVMTSYDTSAFTCACLQGTVTFDAVGESATFRYLGSNTWTIVALQGATVA